MKGIITISEKIKQNAEWINVGINSLLVLIALLLLIGCVSLRYTGLIYVGIGVYLGIPIVNWIYRMFSDEGFNEGAKKVPLLKSQKDAYDLVLTILAVLFIPIVFAIAYGFEIRPFNFIQYFAIFFLSGCYSAAMLDVAHEFIHSPNKIKKTVATIIFAYTSFMGFCIEHLHLHHARKHFLGKEDMEWARYNEGIYQYIKLSTIQGWKIIWRCEAKRLLKEKRSPYNIILNKGYRLVLFPIISYGILLMFFSPLSVLLTMISIFHGTLRFYVRGYNNHYALSRALNPITHKPEPIALKHAWDRNDPITKYLLFGVMRHNYHHISPGMPWYNYVKEPTGPNESPFGYEMTFYIGLIPILYKKIMAKKITELGDKANINKEFIHNDKITSIRM